METALARSRIVLPGTDVKGDVEAIYYHFDPIDLYGHSTSSVHINPIFIRELQYDKRKNWVHLLKEDPEFEPLP